MTSILAHRPPSGGPLTPSVSTANPSSGALTSRNGTEPAAAQQQHQVVGKYALGKVLGSGDFDCRVRLCTHTSTGAVYAVRIYEKKILREAPWIWHQLAEAVQVMRTMPKHENIVEMVECFETASSLFILMNFVKGTSLTRLMNESSKWSGVTAGAGGKGGVLIPQPPPGGARHHLGESPVVRPIVSPNQPSASTGIPPSVADDAAFLSRIPRIMAQLLKGVYHMHANQYVHLGIAPDHILLTDDEDHMVKITFLVMCRNAPPNCRFTMVTGTTHTTAPEVLLQYDHVGYDPRKADAWSCGVVLYFLLSGGTYPFSGANAKRNIIENNIRPLDPRLPRPALDLVVRLLSYNPAHRLTVEEALRHPYVASALGGAGMAGARGEIGRIGGAPSRTPTLFGIISYWSENIQKPVIRKIPQGLTQEETSALWIQHAWLVVRRRRKELLQLKAEREDKELLMGLGGTRHQSMTGGSKRTNNAIADAFGAMQMVDSDDEVDESHSGRQKRGQGNEEDDVSPSLKLLATMPPWQKAHMCPSCQRMPPPRVEPGKLPFPYVAPARPKGAAASPAFSPLSQPLPPPLPPGQQPGLRELVAAGGTQVQVPSLNLHSASPSMSGNGTPNAMALITPRNQDSGSLTPSPYTGGGFGAPAIPMAVASHGGAHASPPKAPFVFTSSVQPAKLPFPNLKVKYVQRQFVANESNDRSRHAANRDHSGQQHSQHQQQQGYYKSAPEFNLLTALQSAPQSAAMGSGYAFGSAQSSVVSTALGSGGPQRRGHSSVIRFTDE